MFIWQSNLFTLINMQFELHWLSAYKCGYFFPPLVPYPTVQTIKSPTFDTLLPTFLMFLYWEQQWTLFCCFNLGCQHCVVISWCCAVCCVFKGLRMTVSNVKSPSVGSHADRRWYHAHITETLQAFRLVFSCATIRLSQYIYNAWLIKHDTYSKPLKLADAFLMQKARHTKIEPFN